jgi:hypothetical protein
MGLVDRGYAVVWFIDLFHTLNNGQTGASDSRYEKIVANIS